MLFRFFIALLLGCTLSLNTASIAQSSEIKIGVLPAADTLLLQVAHDEGLFAKQGLEVTLVPFQSALELGAAMRAGALNGHLGDIINVVIQYNNGIKQRIIATTSRSNAGRRFFGLAITPHISISSIEELQGKAVGTARATIIDFLLSSLLHQQGIPLDALERRDIRQIGVRLQLLLNGQITSAMLPEPLLSLAEARGAHILLTDKTLRTPLAVIALEESLAMNPEVCTRFRSALVEAAARINANPAHYKQMMLNNKLLPEEAAPLYHMLQFTLNGSSHDLPSEQDIQEVIDWMRVSKMLSNTVSPKDILLP